MSERCNGGSSTESIAPMYRRLPRGPHNLAPTEVTRHQRLRMHGAMVAAVDANGYAQTSVKRVIGLAGVSRRAFYEQFANKEDCFLATFDLIAATGAKRVGDAYRTASGGVEQRLRAGVGVFTERIESNPKSARLAIVEAQTAGMVGVAHQRQATAAFEQMLCRSFASDPDMAQLPVPVLRGIVGGMHEAIAVRLREERTKEIPALGEELLDWMLLFQTPSLGRLSESLAAQARASAPATHKAKGRQATDAGARDLSAGPDIGRWLRAPARATAGTNGTRNANGPRNGNGNGNGGQAVSDSPGELRTRLLASVLVLSVEESYNDLSAPEIAEHAGVPVDIFFDLFDSKEASFLAAFDELGDELVRAASDSELVSGDWPRAVRRAMHELMSMLASRPLYARMIAHVAPSVGPQALASNYELARKIATLLTDGAPTKTPNRLATEGVAGAIWHTIRCQVVSNQIHLLPAVADYLAYVALAPFVGAEAAAEVVLEDDLSLVQSC